MWLIQPWDVRRNVYMHPYTHIHTYIQRKEGMFGVLCCFQELRSYRDKIETRNQWEISLSLCMVPRGLSVADGPKTVLHNTAHLYSDQANPLLSGSSRDSSLRTHAKELTVEHTVFLTITVTDHTSIIIMVTASSRVISLREAYTINSPAIERTVENGLLSAWTTQFIHPHLLASTTPIVRVAFGGPGCKVQLAAENIGIVYGPVYITDSTPDPIYPYLNSSVVKPTISQSDGNTWKQKEFGLL